MIHELLTAGKANARTGRELAIVLNCDIREITAQIERERRAGQPICASMAEPPGYYLAATADELERYCNAIHKRAGELYKTRRALTKVLKRIRDSQQEGNS